MLVRDEVSGDKQPGDEQRTTEGKETFPLLTPETCARSTYHFILRKCVGSIERMLLPEAVSEMHFSRQREAEEKVRADHL